MSPLEKRRIFALIRRMRIKADFHSRRSLKTNNRIKKQGQTADEEWNDMWFDEGVAYGISHSVACWELLIKHMERKKIK